MSKEITVTIKESQGAKHIRHSVAETLLDTLQKQNIAEGSFCKGLSSCGHCKVRFVKGAPFPSVRDRQFFSPQELRQGYRLACQAKPVQDCSVELYFVADEKLEIIAGNTLHTTVNEKYKAGEHLRITKIQHPFIAVDIGTTTVVMQLADGESGEVLHTVKFLNPQRSFGFDVLSRIQAAQKQGNVLREKIVKALEQGIKQLQKEAACTEEPELLCITGNTAMLHIFMGYDTTGLGKSPFSVFHLACEETVFCGIRTVLMPSVSAFVGADVTAGIWESKMQESDKITLLLDLGTNGEMALGNREKILTCAAAAGPAFEGGLTEGVYGADILGAIALLLEQGIIDESGYMEQTNSCVYRSKKVEITLEKVREIQLAKAAIRAGIELLTEKYGLSSYEEIDKVHLAGGFGFFLDPAVAVRTGLLPKELEKKAKPVGNSALAGAVSFGKAYWKDAGKARHFFHTDKIESFNLAGEKEFQEKFINNMNFPQSH